MNLSTIIKEAGKRFDKDYNAIDNYGIIYGKGGETIIHKDGSQLEAIKDFLSQELKSLAEDMAKELVPEEKYTDYETDIISNPREALVWHRRSGYNEAINEIKQRLETYLK